MSAADIFGLVVSLAVLRLPRLRAVPRGALLVSGQGIAQIVFYAVVLIALGYPLGLYMARVYATGRAGARALRQIERGFYRLVGTDARREQDWKGYAKSVLVFSVVFFGCSSTRSSGCRATSS